MTTPIPPTAKMHPPRSAKVGMPEDDLACPKCAAMNRPAVKYVWRVTDERGEHFECCVCAHSWPAARAGGV